MKKKIAISLIALFATAISCTKESKDGDWDPMKLSKNEIVFPAEGGTDSIKVKNYSSWWISSVFVNNSDDFRSTKADWMEVVVPNDKRNWVFVTVSENTTDSIRQAYLEMTAGDIFKSIPITQNSK
ncbi:MAG: BACON domain-containing protein [Salinivirgaceae bacterium]|nr:BACON domain-containing protein [Salinivirgaceae bacterium]